MSGAGAGAEDEAVALGELGAPDVKPGVKKARVGGAPVGGKESQDHFSRHLGPSVAQSAQVTLDAKLAAQLADSDASARSAASRHGVPPGGGLGEICFLSLSIRSRTVQRLMVWARALCQISDSLQAGWTTTRSLLFLLRRKLLPPSWTRLPRWPLLNLQMVTAVGVWAP